MVAPAWGLHGICGDMFVCGIIYSPSGCLFGSCVFQSLPPPRYPLEVPVWDLRHVEKYSTPQGSCGELSAVTDFQDLRQARVVSIAPIRCDGSVEGCSSFKRLKCSTRAP